MLQSDTSNMPHAESHSPTTASNNRYTSGTNTSHLDNSTHSSASSPRSQEASVASTVSQNTQGSLHDARKHRSTSPSSIASSQGQDTSKEGTGKVTSLGRKRTINGQMKDCVKKEYTREADHVRNVSTQSQISSTNLTELSQSLKTRLSYAMVKVQNGWQNHTLDEVESLASQSPRSTLSGFNRADQIHLVSPRTVLASTLREPSRLSNVSSSSSSRDTDLILGQQQGLSEPIISRRALGPAATILAGARKRPTPNGNLQINTMKPPQSSRPRAQERTPSQNAAMEADAVETLLFMSSSPKTSGNFPPIFSPISQAFSSQSSPTRIRFSPTARRNKHADEDRSILFERLLNNLDDDTNDDLDEAYRILEQHRASKVSS